MTSKKELSDLAHQQNKLAYLKSIKAKQAQADSFIQVDNLGIGERDPSTGKYQTIFPNQGTFLGGEKIFNSSLPYGSKVRASQPNAFSSIALDHKNIKPLPPEIPEEIPVKKKIRRTLKVLFYVYDPKTDTFDLYIGGDRLTPVKIYSFGFDSAQAFPALTLTSLGSGLDEWVVGFANSDYIANIYPGNRVCSFPFSLDGTSVGIMTVLFWNNGGFWTGSQIAYPDRVYTSRSSTTGAGGYITNSDSWIFQSTAPLVSASGSGSSVSGGPPSLS